MSSHDSESTQHDFPGLKEKSSLLLDCRFLDPDLLKSATIPYPQSVRIKIHRGRYVYILCFLACAFSSLGKDNDTRKVCLLFCWRIKNENLGYYNFPWKGVSSLDCGRVKKQEQSFTGKVGSKRKMDKAEDHRSYIFLTWSYIYLHGTTRC